METGRGEWRNALLMEGRQAAQMSLVRSDWLVLQPMGQARSTSSKPLHFPSLWVWQLNLTDHANRRMLDHVPALGTVGYVKVPAATLNEVRRSRPNSQ